MSEGGLLKAVVIGLLTLCVAVPVSRLAKNPKTRAAITGAVSRSMARYIGGEYRKSQAAAAGTGAAASSSLASRKEEPSAPPDYPERRYSGKIEQHLEGGGLLLVCSKLKGNDVGKPGTYALFGAAKIAAVISDGDRFMFYAEEGGTFQFTSRAGRVRAVRRLEYVDTRNTPDADGGGAPAPPVVVAPIPAVVAPVPAVAPRRAQPTPTREEVNREILSKYGSPR